jgi:hypothetical protein
MPIFKCVWLFQSGDQPAGWSEVFYTDATDIAQAQKRMNSIQTLRCQILDPKNTLSSLRISTVQGAVMPPFIRNQRAAQLFELNSKGGAREITPGSDLVWTGAMVRFFNDDQTIFRNITFRGVPDEFFSSDTPALANAAMVKFASAFATGLVEGSFKIIHTVRPNRALNPVQITGGIFQRMVKRSTGRFFATLRGRR